MKIFVTGNKGYIGSVLCDCLLKENFTITGLDTEFFEDGGELKQSNDIKQIKKDIREIFDEDIKGHDAIIHLAALSNDPIGALDPKLTTEINYRASVKLAHLAKKNNVSRFIFSSWSLSSVTEIHST